MEDEQIESALAMINAGIDMLRKANLSSVSSVDVVGVVNAVELVRRRFEPVEQRLLAEITTRGIAGEFGRTSPADLLVERLKLHPADAKARLSRASELGPRHELSGLELDPILPATSAVVASGEISARHADVIIKTVHKIPTDLQAEFTGIVEHALIEQSRRTHPGQVEKAAEVLLDRINPDGRKPKDDDDQRMREFWLRKKADGSSRPAGYFTPELTAVLECIFDSLAAPDPAADGTPDPRSVGQRRHDALLETGKRVMRSALPHVGGTPVTLSVIMAIDDYVAGVGTATTSHGDLISVAEILKQAADAEIIPVVLSEVGGVLGYGRDKRGATCGQRRVLSVRDRGCSFPGCTRPPAWCEAHHIIPWHRFGLTDVDNLTLLCGYHHRNFEALGWSCHMVDGIPMWTPPAWLDPDQIPIRNTANHIEIDFDTG